jgi:hypothetical protein
LNYTHCVLCKTELKNFDNGWFYTLLCEGCEVDGMSKFQASYRKKDNKLIYMVWWIEDFYIKLDYLKQTTEVSKIDVVVLLSTFKLSHILDIDHDNPSTTARRLQALMIFS